MAEEIKQKPASEIKCTLTLQHYEQATVNQVCTTPSEDVTGLVEEQYLVPTKCSCFAGTDPEFGEKCRVLGLAARTWCPRQQM